VKLLAFFVILFTTQPVLAADNDVRLYRLDCGRIMVRDAHLIDPKREHGSVLEMANSCYLIKHADEWLMWDTGLPDAWADISMGLTSKWSGEGPFELFVDKTIEGQLAEIGLAYGDIGHVGFSSLMFAHTGNANKFKHATWWVQKAEYDAAKKMDDPLNRYRAIRFKDIDVVSRKLLDGQVDVFGDGAVMIISAAGHSAGHQVLQVKLKNNGTVLLGGGSAISLHYASKEGARFMAVDGDAAEKTFADIEARAIKENAQLWFSHDPIQPGFIGSAPEYLD
jgi:N-acyl homoserine lactone hydrolase